ncbi:MAG: CAP domain-containing protein [Patescibacteria group bacterium]
MKIFSNILVIAFVIFSLYIVKDDVRPIYERTISYVKNHANDFKISLEGLSDLPATSIKEEGESSALPRTSSSSEPADTPGPLRILTATTSVSEAERISIKNVIALTNQNRAANGNLPALAENAKLDISARKKLDDMFAQQYFEHDSPQGIGIADLGKQIGYNYITIGENLALGNFKDDKALVDAWMASPGHRANILNSHYTEIGVAVGEGIFEGKRTWMAVQHFGLPRSACPTVDTVLNTLINATQKEIKTLEDELSTRKQRIDSGAIYDGHTKNEQIDQYNALINKYNQFVVQLKERINDYNTQVRSFNSCITKNSAH